jgi:hypothetical protein
VGGLREGLGLSDFWLTVCQASSDIISGCVHNECAHCVSLGSMSNMMSDMFEGGTVLTGCAYCVFLGTHIEMIAASLRR